MALQVAPWLVLVAGAGLGLELRGRRVAVLGCGAGGTVEGLRGLGVRAYGMDLSRAALRAASASARPFIVRGDARLPADLARLRAVARGPFHACITEDLLPCLTDDEVRDLVSRLDRYAPAVVHCLSLPEALGWRDGDHDGLHRWRNVASLQALIRRRHLVVPWTSVTHEHPPPVASAT